MTDDLVTWLRAQLDEDERVAHSAPPGNWAVWWSAIALSSAPVESDIVRWDRTRVLAEVEVKRRILALHGTPSPTVCDLCSNDRYLIRMPCPTVRLLALPYADCEGFREEWRP